jgi:predicted TPR repeat methyltransferase
VKLEKLGKLMLKDSRILDFGRGTGLLTAKLSPFAKCIVALDTSKAMIKILNQKVTKSGLNNVRPIAETSDAAITTSPNLLYLGSVHE